MTDESTDEPGHVNARMELTGDYEEVMSIVGREEREYESLEPVRATLVELLRAVERTGGATRSKLADELSEDVPVDLDGEQIAAVLGFLELFGVVTLDGNTWMPGPELDRSE